MYLLNAMVHYSDLRFGKLRHHDFHHNKCSKIETVQRTHVLKHG